ncbi:MAG TPA: ABC transporter ATP-binding protein [bacterium]|nr:ABC transporter ATP-binding protein [bacterium]
MSGDVLIRVEGVSKKFARSLKRSMYYGIFDVIRDFLGWSSHSDRLRPDEFWAVRDVSFEVRSGECLGLIGPNGAGKSTILKMLNGLFSPDRGRIEIKGRTGALIELGAGFHPLLSGRENIFINGAILGMGRKEVQRKFDSIVAFSGLEEFLDTPVKFYSSGMYVRLGFAVAAHLDPEILLLDEILAVGDESFQARCFNRIGEIRESGAAVVLVSHNMHRIAGFCERTAYLQGERLRYLGATKYAVAAYMEDVLQTGLDASDGDGRDRAGVYGSGRIRIKEVRFLDRLGRETREIQSNDPVVVRVYYSCNEEVDDPVLDVVMRDSAAGNLFQATNRDCGLPLGRLSGEGCIDIELKGLNVNNQIVDFFFAWWNSKHTELLDWKRHLKLRVVGNPGSSGRMTFAGEWRHRPGPHGPLAGKE